MQATSLPDRVRIGMTPTRATARGEADLSRSDGFFEQAIAPSPLKNFGARRSRNPLQRYSGLKNSARRPRPR